MALVLKRISTETEDKKINEMPVWSARMHVSKNREMPERE